VNHFSFGNLNFLFSCFQEVTCFLVPLSTLLENKGCVSHHGLAIYTKKVSSDKRKESYEKLKHFTTQKYNLQKNPLKETRDYNSVTSLKFQHKPKNHLSKILI
jgi:hypothetical protein